MELSTTTSDRFLRHALEEMLSVAQRVPEPVLNERPAGGGTNSVAALVVHCCGVVEYWLGHVALGEPTTRDRDAEFTSTATIEDLEGLVASTVDGAGHLLERLDDRGGHDEASRPPLYGGDRSDAAIVLHVLEECFQHLGHAELAADVLASRASR